MLAPLDYTKALFKRLHWTAYAMVSTIFATNRSELHSLDFISFNSENPNRIAYIDLGTIQKRTV